MKKKKLFEVSKKGVSLALALSVIFQTVFPTFSYGLTTGPQQQEYASFEPAGTSDLVDLYTGDFTYNIPLMTVPGPNGGYPINLAYHSGSSMEEEASWVGLGWTLNAGAVNRGMRGLPDDFCGDNITKETSMRKYWMVDASVTSADYKEWFGLPWGSLSDPTALISPSYQVNLYYNNYKGIGYRATASASYSLINTGAITTGVGISYDSQSGIGIEPQLGLSVAYNASGKDVANFLSTGVGLSYNSRSGITGGNILGFSFNFNQRVPSASIPTVTHVQPFAVKIGQSTPLAKFKATQYGQLYGSYFETDFSSGSVNYPAYGYTYTRNATSSSMKDFTRTTVEYSKHLPSLPASTFNSDQFSYSAQGAYGSFRPWLAGVAVLNDAMVENPTTCYDPLSGIEVGVSPTTFNVGFDLNYFNGFTRSGGWQNSGKDEEVNDIEFLDGTGTDFNLAAEGDDLAFEEVAYTSNNELNRFLYNENGNSNFYDNWAGSDAVRVELEKNSQGWIQQSYKAKGSFKTSSGSTFTISANQKNKRHKVRRQSNIEVTHFDKAKKYGRSLAVKYLNTSSSYVSLYPNSHSDKHIAEVSVLQSDGMRYNYSMPVYSKSQKQVAFSADNTNYNHNTTNVDVPSALNVSGTYLQMVDKTTLPEYPQSWLISSVVSADYADRTGDGFTDDDLGYWVKFTYKKSDDKKWRFPYRGADFMEGKVGDQKDDMAFYSYGEKEVYFLDSVITKTHYAKFFTSNRQDAIDAPGEINNVDYLNGTPTGTTQTLKLDSIQLWAKGKILTCQEGQSPSPFKLKSVHFRYTYDLCRGVSNNMGQSVNDAGTTASNDTINNINYYKGKLTLKKVYFQYEGSKRGQYNPYEFNYGSRTSSVDNPGYDSRNIDRWGTYKNNSGYTVLGTSNKYPFANMPYADQGSGSTGPDVSAWNLKQITLPSGSKINVEYESDDYAYNEDQKALRMFDILGTGPDHDPDYADKNPGSYKEVSMVNAFSVSNKFKIYFPLETPIITGSPDHSIVYKKYLDNGNIKKVYFKSFMNIYNSIGGTTKDWVDGYADVMQGGTAGTDYGIESSAGNTTYDMGWITLRGEKISVLPDNIHPFTAAAINYLRLNRRDVTESYTPNNNGALAQITDFLTSVPSLIGNIMQMWTGFNNYAYLHGAGWKARLNGWSVIRLCDPDQKKFGGGLRVKKLTFTDNWETSASLNQSYAQTYEYKMEDGTSSGVAYEPLRGDEESALTMPIEYSESMPLGGTDHYALRTPLMKDYYPAQQVGYRRVVVKSDAPTRAYADDNSNQLKKSAAPVTVYKFYSPKEFPVLFDDTELETPNQIRRPFGVPGLFYGFKNKIARSQGYKLELNDMAGKLCSVTSHARDVGNSSNTSELGAQISKTEYVYQTESAYNPNASNKLNNLANVITTDSSYQTAYVGLNEEVFIDMKEDKYVNKVKTFGFNLFGGVTPTPPPIPYIFPTVIPMPIEKTETSLRTVLTNKIIYRRGLLKETRVTSDQSTVTTEIVAYDFETGNPILTRVNNEFEDAVYNYTIPAHLEYSRMGGAYKNYNVTVVPTTTVTMAPTTAGLIQFDSTLTNFPHGKKASAYFTIGDAVAIEYNNGTNTKLCYVLGTHDAGMAHGIYVIDATGKIMINTSLPNIISVKVVQSGYQNLMDYDAGGIVAKSCDVLKYEVGNASTLKSSATAFSFGQSDKILNASAVAYTDVASLSCDPETVEAADTMYNPFKWKTRGVWKPYKSFAYIANRKSSMNSIGNVPPNVRDDGWFETFQEFNWSDIGLNPTWTETGTVTKFSNYGFTLEQKDALGNYSSALYGFGMSLNTASASNAAYHEIAFKSFEDEMFVPDCGERRDDSWVTWQIVPYASLSTTHAHTGKYSLQVPSGSSYTFDSNAGGTACATTNDNYTGSSTQSIPPVKYNPDNCTCIGRFSPQAGKRYVISAWGKRPQSALYNDYDNSNSLLYLEVKFQASGSPTGTTVNVYPSGKHIEGWQRYYGEFVVPAGATSMTVRVVNGAGVAGYLDDLRIHPYNATMISYVYDPNSYKLLAQLDANNYASVLGYNEQGSAEIAKKETAEGVKTVSSARTYIKKR